jgi:uncharacterized protein (TIGR03067 family)
MIRGEPPARQRLTHPDHARSLPMTPLVLGLALALGAPAPKKGDDPAPAKLEGEWVVESFEGEKKSPPPGSLVMTFADGKIAIREGMREKKEQVDYTADRTKKPATIDIMPGKGDDVVKGIFEIKGDVLKICFGKEGADRPTEFKADEDKRIVVITLKRAKPEK